VNRTTAVLAMALSVTLAPVGLAQPSAVQIASGQTVSIEPPDAQRTRQEFYNLIQRYPPSLKSVMALDPSLLSSPSYLAPYPALAAFLNAHPEIAHNPSFYVADYNERRGFQQDRPTAAMELWRSVIDGTGVFLGFAMAIGVAVWLVRTIVDYRRWNRLAKVQTDVHTRILDRFTDNADLLAYMQSQPGKRFLESTPIMLDAGPRSVGAPLGRILWSVQAGLVLTAAGIGIDLVSWKFTEDAAQPMQVLGALGIALGVGFVLSALISFWISNKLGLIEPPFKSVRQEPPSGL
jgi:hypothetical protein